MSLLGCILSRILCLWREGKGPAVIIIIVDIFGKEGIETTRKIAADMDFVGVGWRATAEFGSAVEAVPPVAEVKVPAGSLCIVQLGYPFLLEHTDVCCIRLN